MVFLIYGFNEAYIPVEDIFIIIVLDLHHLIAYIIGGAAVFIEKLPDASFSCNKRLRLWAPVVPLSMGQSNCGVFNRISLIVSGQPFGNKGNYGISRLFRIFFLYKEKSLFRGPVYFGILPGLPVGVGDYHASPGLAEDGSEPDNFHSTGIYYIPENVAGAYRGS